MIKTFIPLTWLYPIVNLKTRRRYQKGINLHQPLSHEHLSNFEGGLGFFCLVGEVLGFFFLHLKGTEAIFPKQAIKRNIIARYQGFPPPPPYFLKQERVPDQKSKKLQIQDSPLHNNESVDHVFLLILCFLQLFCQDVAHGALQQIGHFHIAVPIEHTIKGFPVVAEVVGRKCCHTQPREKTKQENIRGSIPLLVSQLVID